MAQLSEQCSDTLLGWIGKPNASLELLYSSSQHGLSTAEFHKRCENKGSTFTLLRMNSGYLCGGYASSSWTQTGGFREDANIFLFRLENGNGSTSAQKWHNKLSPVGITNNVNYGPHFGYNCGYTLYIPLNSQTLNCTCTGYFFQSQNDFNQLHGGNPNFTDCSVYSITDKPVEKQPEKKILEKPWRKVVQKWDEGVRDALKTEIVEQQPPEEIDLPFTNILLVGPINAGKSSFFNTINSAYRGYVTAQAATGSSAQGLTTKFRTYEVKCRPSSQNLKVRFCDTLGIGDGKGINVGDITYLVDGNIPDQFQFNTLTPITPGTYGFMESPEPHHKMHVVAFVISAKDVDQLSDKITDKLLTIKTMAHARGIPLVVLLTHIDEILETPEELSKVFHSQTVLSAVEVVAATMGVPKGHVLPVKNYESEIELESHVDILALVALRQILRFADGYYDDQLAMRGASGLSDPRSYKVKSNLSKTEKLDQPN